MTTTPPLRMDQFLPIKDAVKLTGKSESTIKRMIREVVNDPGHDDRSLILPSSEEIEEKRKSGEPYIWRIHRDLLLKRFPPEDGSEPSGANPVQTADQDRGSTQIMEVLREQLQSKDRQIATLETQLDRKDQQIHSLNERMHETHILMNELQKRLAIAPPVQNAESATEKGTARAEAKPASAKSIWTRPITDVLFRRKGE
ncbi:MAG: hypothetical protein KDA80_05970 [Planctomycetaceae bacterium]|nr:hypothetical protein [Planctomycetaceae bacterium]